MARRADGVLENEIMAVLWAEARPLTPGEVLELIPSTLAYTSVATVLGRLHEKGLVERCAVGRAFAYTATVDEADLAVRKMRQAVDSASDRDRVLAGFLGSLSKKDADRLGALLAQRKR